MNINLLLVLSNFIKLVAVSFIAITSETVTPIEVATEKIDSVNKIVEYNTLIQYSKSMPLNATNTLIAGENGLITIKNGEEITLKEKTDRIIQVGIGKEGIYSGYLTEYGPDCDTCDGRGITFCRTKEGNWHSLTKDGIYYKDYQYGEIRILAADQRQFPCGTIIEIHNSDLSVMLGIVIDTGYGMKKAYNEGWILLDLAVTSEKNITFGMNNKTTFYVKRWGW